MNHNVTLCGWRVRSEIALPEALPWRGPDHAPVDVTVRIGEVPEQFTMPGANRGPVVSVAPDGSRLMRIDGVGRYLTRGGNEVVIAPECPLDAPDLRLFVQTACLSALIWQRGWMPFHGAVVEVADRAIALLGTSGAGKSSVALALVRRGHRYLAEEHCVLDHATPDGWPLVRPTYPDIRVWRDTLDHFGIPVDGLAPNRTGQLKYHYTCPEAFVETPRPLAAVVVLSQRASGPGPVTMEPLKGAVGLARVGLMVQRRAVARMLGQGRRILDFAEAVVRARRAFALDSETDVGHLDAAAAAIEELASTVPAAGHAVP